MEKVENNLFVSVDYKGTLSNGEVFDTSEGRQPLEVQMGSGNVIPGFESALMGMSLNETKTFTLSPEEAYGHRDEDQMHDFPKSDIPDGMQPEVGQTLMLRTPQGQQIPARVDSIDDEKVTFDLNHPLAGQSLTFKVEVVAISETATQQQAGCGSHCSSGGCGCDDSGGCC
ncbi:peptidyl-prolyl cis-trans isomerase [Desulfosarcina alkanivorans]|uniref:Peptidyl-prolyl cis-trans isomerase n=1 Tax=Desulfosarcina alkanivorans TaxID=571177 RepID=A0A5K7YBF1_9BACT|nr:peptidylprolyl isomerase [Desulfosarcina alkanivorans]BBO66488.1 peptidyl-prolyl cis-trans isomerase [Desulfosarcina alkanivorans]